ncbi:hypothetical protein MVEN_00277300 [Mycena venus]|uniref:Uncharacterized protein n=1 Tax=Mycena venus TaxID=2733690 RepID=A0A8H7DFF5_9AGAR|nr:hypothetical protein MVEN_00277300 [Mycena venus]
MLPSGSTLASCVLLALSTVARGDYFSKNPLVDKAIPYDKIPCSQSPDSCPTDYYFCLWAPRSPGSTIGDTEGDEVAWCIKNGHGTRMIPAGAITGVQLVQTPSYIQIAGTINQAMLNIQDDDAGGELDSGGQDGEGNPMGGLVYTNVFPASNGNNDTISRPSTGYCKSLRLRNVADGVLTLCFSFMGNSAFCGKICDQTKSNPQGLCNNVYDRLGCKYNVPSNAQAGTFEACKGDDMLPVGVYVGADRQTSIYHQPAATDPIGSIPYKPTPAPTSSCTPFQSAVIFAATAGSGNSGMTLISLHTRYTGAKHRSKAGAIAGGVVGGTAAVVLGFLGFCTFRRPYGACTVLPTENIGSENDEFRPWAENEATGGSSTASAATPPSSTPARDPKQPIILRWDPPAPAPRPESASPTRPEFASPPQSVSAPPPHPSSLPSCEELATKVERLREHITALSPPA